MVRVKLEKVFTNITWILLLIAPLSGLTTEHSSAFRDIVPAFFAVGMMYLLSDRKIRCKRNVLWAFAYVIWLFITTVLNGRSISTSVLTSILFAMFFCLMLGKKLNKKQMSFVIKMNILISIIAAVAIVCGAIFSKPYSPGRYSLDFIGIRKNPNYVTGYIMFSYTWCLYHLVFGTIKAKKVLIGNSVALCLFLYAFFLSGTRAALLISLLIAVFVVVAYILKKGIKPRIIVLVGLGIVACTYVFQFIADIVPQWILEDRLNFMNIIQSDDVRLVLWSDGLDEFARNNVMLGLGVNGIERFSHETSGLSLHNVLLQVLLEAGIIGTILFGLLFFDGQRKVKKTDKLLLFLLSTALFLPLLFQNGMYSLSFWYPVIMRSQLMNYSAESDCGIGEMLAYGRPINSKIGNRSDSNGITQCQKSI